MTERPFVNVAIVNMQKQLYYEHKSSHNVSRREREKEMSMRYCMRNLVVVGNLGAVAPLLRLAKSIYYPYAKGKSR